MRTRLRSLESSSSWESVTNGGLSFWGDNKLNQSWNWVFHNLEFQKSFMVTIGPVCLTKLTRKQKLVRTLGFFLDFFPQLISTTGSWDSPPVYLVTMGPVCLTKLTRKWKLVRTLGFFLDFFPSSFRPLEAEIARLCTWWPWDLWH